VRTNIAFFDVDQRPCTLSVLANVLWLQGFPDQAKQTGIISIDEARASEHPISLCLALKWGGATISLKTGDLTGAERTIAELIEHAEKHALDTDYACGIGLRGQLSAKRGDFVEAMEHLRAALDGMRESRFHVLYSESLSELAKAFAGSGNVAEGLVMIDEALERIIEIQELWLMPEVLRLKGELLLMQDTSNSADAESHFLRALDCARGHGALSWELRAALSLGQLHRDQDRIQRARDGLSSVYGRFTEGFGTADLLIAKQLLDEFSALGE
jgi:tetratricopeptide (TPR) repeat protein